jgi:hypothetical protein
VPVPREIESSEAVVLEPMPLAHLHSAGTGTTRCDRFQSTESKALLKFIYLRVLLDLSVNNFDSFITELKLQKTYRSSVLKLLFENSETLIQGLKKNLLAIVFFVYASQRFNRSESEFSDQLFGSLNSDSELAQIDPARILFPKFGALSLLANSISRESAWQFCDGVVRAH